MESKLALRAVRRLRRDYEELVAVNSAEMPYAAAAPMGVLVPETEDSLKSWLKWKVTLMGPPDSRFAGILLHVTLDFPSEFPVKGPRATIQNNYLYREEPLKQCFRHSHVYSDWICLSILDDYIPCHYENSPSESSRQEGWSYGYSVSSILVQLQSFLFDEDPQDGASTDKGAVARAFRASRAYSCEATGHTFQDPKPAPPAWSKGPKGGWKALQCAQVLSALDNAHICSMMVDRFGVPNSDGGGGRGGGGSGGGGGGGESSAVSLKKDAVSGTTNDNGAAAVVNTLRLGVSNDNGADDDDIQSKKQQQHDYFFSPFTSPAAGGVPCVVLECSADHGALLRPNKTHHTSSAKTSSIASSSAAATAVSTSNELFSVGRGEAVKVGWSANGKEVEFVAAFAPGDQVVVWPTSTATSNKKKGGGGKGWRGNRVGGGGDKGSVGDETCGSSKQEASLVPPRPRTMHKEAQRRIVAGLEKAAATSSTCSIILPAGGAAVAGHTANNKEENNNATNRLWGGHCAASSCTVLTVIGNKGCLVALGPVMEATAADPSHCTTTTPTPRAHVLAPAGLVALLPFSACPPSHRRGSAFQTGDVVGGSAGLWITSVSSSSKQLEVGCSNPATAPETRPASHARVQGAVLVGLVTAVHALSDTEAALAAISATALPPSSSRSASSNDHGSGGGLKEEWALVSLARGVVGRLTITSVRNATTAAAAAKTSNKGTSPSSSSSHSSFTVWELSDVGVVAGAEVSVVVVDATRMGTPSDPLGLDLVTTTTTTAAAAAPSSTDQNSLATLASSSTSQSSSTRFSPRGLFHLSDYMIMDVLDFLSRADLHALSTNGLPTNLLRTTAHIHGKKSKKKIKTPTSSSSSSSSSTSLPPTTTLTTSRLTTTTTTRNFHPPRLVRLAEATAARRFTSSDLRCSFLRVPFNSSSSSSSEGGSKGDHGSGCVLLGCGFTLTTHASKHKVLRKQAAQRKAKEVLLFYEDGDELYDYGVGSGGAAATVGSQRALSDWFAGIPGVGGGVGGALGSSAVATASAWGAEKRRVEAAAAEAATASAKEEAALASAEIVVDMVAAEAAVLKEAVAAHDEVDSVSVKWGSLISWEAFNGCDRVRSTHRHETFTHWLPLWVWRSHGQRATKLALRVAVEAMLGKKALVCLSAGAFNPAPSPSPSSFALPGQRQGRHSSSEKGEVEAAHVSAQRTVVLEAFAQFVAKAMNSTVVGMMDGSMHDSEVAFEGYFALYQLLLNIGLARPALLASLRAKVVNFVAHPHKRGKKNCSSLGELLPLLPLAGVPWHEAVEAVVGEAFVRNARWAIKTCPDLADTNDGFVSAASAASSATTAAAAASGGGGGGGGGGNGRGSLSSRETHRLRQTLRANAVSLRLLAFHCVAADLVAADCSRGSSGGGSSGGGPSSLNTNDKEASWKASLKSQAARLETTRGKPSARAVSALQRRTRGLKAGPSEWSDFFAGVGLQPAPRPAFLAAWLRRSVHASVALGYHNQRGALRDAENGRVVAAARKEARAAQDLEDY